MIVVALVTVLIINSCKQKTEKAPETATEKITKSIENFESFYDKFYSDSVFQFSRINFPLKGGEVLGDNYVPSDIAGEESEERKEWNLEDFGVMLKEINGYPSDYKSEIDKSENLIKEKIYLPESGYYEIRHYVLKENEWYLDYFFIQDL